MCPFQTKILVFCCTLPEPPSQLYLTPNSFPLGIILKRRLIIKNHPIPWQYQDPHPRPFTTTQTLSPYLTWLDNTNLCPCNKQIFGCDMSERPVEKLNPPNVFCLNLQGRIYNVNEREKRKHVRWFAMHVGFRSCLLTWFWSCRCCESWSQTCRCLDWIMHGAVELHRILLAHAIFRGFGGIPTCSLIQILESKLIGKLKIVTSTKGTLFKDRAVDTIRFY